MATSDKMHFEPWKEKEKAEAEKQIEELTLIYPEKPATIQYNAEDLQRRIASLQSSYETPQGFGEEMAVPEAILSEEGAPPEMIPVLGEPDMLEMDEDLTFGLAMFDKYIESELQLHRLYLVKHIVDIVRGMSVTEAMSHVLPRLEMFTLDPEIMLREAFAEVLEPLGRYFLEEAEDDDRVATKGSENMHADLDKDTESLVIEMGEFRNLNVDENEGIEQGENRQTHSTASAENRRAAYSLAMSTLVAQYLVPLGLTLFLDPVAEVKEKAVHGTAALGRLFDAESFGALLVPLLEGLVAQKKEENCYVALLFIMYLFEKDEEEQAQPSEEEFFKFQNYENNSQQTIHANSDSHANPANNAIDDAESDSKSSIGAARYIVSTFVPMLEKQSRHKSQRVRELTVNTIGVLVPWMQPKDVEASLLHVYSRLCDDPASVIRIRAAHTMITMMRVVEVDDRARDLVPIVTALLHDNVKSVRVTMTTFLGELIYILRHSDAVDTLVDAYLDALPYATITTSMSTSAAVLFHNRHDDNERLVVAAAFRFPAVVASLGTSQWFRLRGAFKSLAQSNHHTARRPLAYSLHILARLLGPLITVTDLLPVFELFIRDIETVRIGVLTHIHQFMAELPVSHRAPLLPTLDTCLVESGRAWRIRAMIASNLVPLIALFDTSAEEVGSDIMSSPSQASTSTSTSNFSSHSPTFKASSISNTANTAHSPLSNQSSSVTTTTTTGTMPLHIFLAVFLNLAMKLSVDQVAQVRLQAAPLFPHLLQAILHTSCLPHSHSNSISGSCNRTGPLQLTETCRTSLDIFFNALKSLAISSDYHLRLEFIYILYELLPLQRTISFYAPFSVTFSLTDSIASPVTDSLKAPEESVAPFLIFPFVNEELKVLALDKVRNVREALQDLLIEMRHYWSESVLKEEEEALKDLKEMEGQQVRRLAGDLENLQLIDEIKETKIIEDVKETNMIEETEDAQFVKDNKGQKLSIGHETFVVEDSDLKDQGEVALEKEGIPPKETGHSESTLPHDLNTTDMQTAETSDVLKASGSSVSVIEMPQPMEEKT